MFHGNLLTLLNPYGLVGGLTFVLVFGVHGLLWLATRSEGALQARAGLTAFNSASSPLTLKIMLAVVLCFLPVVIGYQVWVFLTFRDPVTSTSVQTGPAH